MDYLPIKREHLFFCYNMHLSKFIYDEYDIRPLTIAINPMTQSEFSLFVRSARLQDAIDDYKAIHKKF